MRLMIFPAAVMANIFAMMVLMIGLSLFGKPELAAEFGLIHGATVALFFSFSGNARSLILAEVTGIDAAKILRLRLLMLVPLSILAWMLCAGVVDGSGLFVLLLVVRRATEWLAEIFLSEQELHNRAGIALGVLIIQGGLSLLLLLALLGDVLVMPMTLIWALSPLFGCMSQGLLRRAVANDVTLLSSIRLLLPHYGSTLAIGVSVYVFRLFILLLVGKQVAGDLFAAFALGGILGAVFSQALGPTMVRHEQRQAGLGSGRLVKAFNLLLIVMLLAGAALGISVWSMPGLLSWTHKSDLFWLAVGCSLVGGALMVLAQRVRIRLLQDGAGRDVFGSDMLANLLLVGCVPLFFFAGGEGLLATLYLAGALLSLVFYLSEDWNGHSWSDDVPRYEKGSFVTSSSHRVSVVDSRRRWIYFLLVLGLFTPIFFQLENGIYQGGTYFRSGGNFSLLPIPLSVLVCYVGIVVLGSYARARTGLVVIFLTFIGMLLSVLLLSDGGSSDVERAKLILLAQYTLPMFALILGMQFGSDKGSIDRLSLALFALLLVVIPVQLLSTWFYGGRHLSSSLFVFGVYQHLQYVPVLLSGAFLIVLFSLWKNGPLQKWLILLAALMGVYVALSVSMLSMLFLLVGTYFFTARNLIERNDTLRVILVALLVSGGAWVGFFYLSNAKLLVEKIGFLFPADSIFFWLLKNAGQWAQKDLEESGPQNLQERLFYWGYYFDGIKEGTQALLFGHEQAPDRTKFPSAHNYYLDFVYNFGFIAALPLVGLVVFTCYRVLKNIGRLWREPDVLGIAGVVVFLLLVDSLFKVGMRQPYPGIITFFLWGVLLASLARWHTPRAPQEQVSGSYK